MTSLTVLATAAGGGGSGASHTEIVLASMLLAVVVLVTGARLLNVPYPIFLVIGGLGISVVPGIPRVEIEPDLVLLLFLPPLLYSAAYFTSLRDMRRNVRPIGLLSTGLVLATTLAVGLIAHALIPGIPWAAAFALGAIVGPTDPVAATAMAGRLGLPSRVVVITEGESLINDATALVAYKVAVAAVLTGAFSLPEAAGRFVLTAAGGLVIGLAVGWVVTQVRRRLDDPPVEITISLLTGYLAYLPAEQLGASGVVAAVTVGLFLGFRAPILTTAETRMQSDAVWSILVFLLNSVLFVLIGLQLPAILDELDSGATSELVGWGVAITLTVMLTRLVWSWVFAYVPHWIFKSLRTRNPVPLPRNIAIISWMGMRGAVSLAAALALPLETDSGAPFPHRDTIIFITFVVILLTLVVQGLSLPWMVKRLGVTNDGDETEREEIKARLHAAKAALRHIDVLADEPWTREDSIERIRMQYRYRQRRFMARYQGVDGDDGEPDFESRSVAWSRLQREVIAAQRDAVIRLRNEGVISDEAMRRVERDLDLEEARMTGA